MLASTLTPVDPWCGLGLESGVQQLAVHCCEPVKRHLAQLLRLSCLAVLLDGAHSSAPIRSVSLNVSSLASISRWKWSLFFKTVCAVVGNEVSSVGRSRHGHLWQSVSIDCVRGVSRWQSSWIINFTHSLLNGGDRFVRMQTRVQFWGTWGAWQTSGILCGGALNTLRPNRGILVAKPYFCFPIVDQGLPLYLR